MLLGEMLVVGKPPAKFIKALAAIAGVLHSSFDEVVVPGRSKRSCVLCSLTVRDFLWRVGFKDARAVTVYTAIRADDKDGNEIHSVGVGDHTDIPTMGPKPVDTDKSWSGHMVVEVPSAGYVVDTTLYQMQRPAWPFLQGMMAVPIEREAGRQSFGLDHLTGVEATDRASDGVRLRMWWLVQPNERWRGGADAERGRREPVVRALVKAFGKWSD